MVNAALADWFYYRAMAGRFRRDGTINRNQNSIWLAYWYDRQAYEALKKACSASAL